MSAADRGVCPGCGEVFCECNSVTTPVKASGSGENVTFPPPDSERTFNPNIEWSASDEKYYTIEAVIKMVMECDGLDIVVHTKHMDARFGNWKNTTPEEVVKLLTERGE